MSSKNELVSAGPPAFPFHTQYTEPVKVRTINDEPSMTHQSFKDEQDVNFIIDRYTQTGFLPPLRPEGAYMDATMVEDYQTLMNNLIAVRTAFEALPDEIRQEFQSPEDWINAALDQERLSAILDRLNEEDPEGSSDSSEVTAGTSGQSPEGAASAPPAQ